MAGAHTVSSGPGRPTRRRRPMLFVGLSLAGVLMLCIPTVVPARFVWNVTASAPTGIYVIDNDAWRTGDRVAVQPDSLLAADLETRGVLPRGKLLIKRAAAGQGDEVCRIETNVTVNGAVVAVAKITSSAGKPLPTWAGCQRLASSQVLLIGETENSYDGRYFGPTAASDVLGRANLVLSF